MSNRARPAGETVGAEDPVSGGDRDGALRPVDSDHYRLEEQIGQGGLGRLMRARDERLGRTVAIKLMRRVSTELEVRFRREAEITARLQHPGIVPIHEVGRWPTGEPYYTMKLVSGSSLKEVIAGLPTLAQRLALLHKLLSVCESIAYAHSEGVIHRDLKPANIMIGAFGEALVIDWGLATEVGPAQPVGTPNEGRERPARGGSIVGTPAYMPVEQARGDEVDRRADVYALGAVLYHVLAGRPPYEGTTSEDVMRAVLKHPAAPLATVAKDAPRELIAIADKAMARAADDRYRDAAELAADLKRFLDGQLVGAHRYSPWQRLRRVWRHHRAVVSVVVASAVALTAFGTYSVRRIVVEREAAEAARAQAESQSASLLLAQTKLWMDRDPTVAVAWLKQYARTARPDPAEIGALAADAKARGAATQRVLDRKNAVLAPDGKTLAGVSGDQVVVWSIDDPVARSLGRVSGPLGALAFSSDSRAVFSAEAGSVRARDVTGGSTRELYAGDEPVSQLVSAGPLLVAGGERGSLWLIDPDGKLKTRALAAHAVAVGELVSSSDGRVVLSHASDKRTLLWRLPTGDLEPLSLVDAAPKKTDTKHATLSPDGGWTAWGDDEGVVRVRELATGQVTELRGHQGQIQRVVFSADGKRLASTSADSSVRIWDIASGHAQILTGHTSWTQRAAFSADGSMLASTSLDHTVRIWDLDTGDCQVLRGHNGKVGLLSFTPDGQALVTGEPRGEVRVWPVIRSTERVIQIHAGNTGYLHFLPDGRLLAADDLGTVLVLAPATGALARFRFPVGKTAIGLSYETAPDGSAVMMGDADGSLHRLQLATGEVRTFVGGGGQIAELTVSRDGRHAATAAFDHAVRLWDLASGEQRVLGRHPLAAWHVAFSPDDRLLASAGDDLNLRVWDLERATLRELAGHTGLVYQLRFSPDGRYLASAGVDTTVRIWDLSNGTARVLAGHTSLIEALAYAPDGRTLASGGDDGTTRLWDLGSGRSTVLDHGASVGVVAFARDGKVLATGASDGTVRLWDVARASLRSVERGNAFAVMDLAVSDDGRWLAVSAEDGSVRVWADPWNAPRAPSTAEGLAQLGSVELTGEQAISGGTETETPRIIR